MNHLVKLSIPIMISVWLCISNAFAQETVHVEAYASLQNCMAEARDVMDNGSYETYCIEAYKLAVKTEMKNMKLNSNTTGAE